MKIFCEKCHNDISNLVDVKFEQYVVGNIICPKCKHKQKRYISQADLMLFLAISCIFYAFASYGILTMMKTIGFNLYLIPAIIVAYVIIYFIHKTISRLIYQNAYLKKDIKDIELIEDSNAITKSMRVRFAAFTFLIIMFGTGANDMWIFLALTSVFSIVMFINTYQLIKNEKKITQAKK